VAGFGTWKASPQQLIPSNLIGPPISDTCVACCVHRSREPLHRGRSLLGLAAAPDDGMEAGGVRVATRKDASGMAGPHAERPVARLDRHLDAIRVVRVGCRAAEVTGSL
jgi:hypothetical protein